MKEQNIYYSQIPPVNSDRWLDNTDLPGEEWRDIKGFEKFYLVSNYGRVKRLPTKKQYPSYHSHYNIRKEHIKNGYYQVNLSKDSKVKWIYVHRLVAMTFLRNPDNLPQVNHKDENKLNNFVGNLEWCTPKYNCNYGTGIARQVRARKANDYYVHGWEKGLRTRNANPNNPNRSIPIVATFPDGTKKVFDSITQAAKMVGVDRFTIKSQLHDRLVRTRRCKIDFHYANPIQ